MATIDSNSFTVTCPKCSQESPVTVRERGSVYNSTWETPPILPNFDLKWKDHGASSGPKIDSAKCRKCGVDAVVVFRG
jgi:hypothetical protein